MPATPPSGVMTVLRRPPTWDEAKKQLGDASFMTKLIEYDKDKIDDGLLKKVAKFTVVGRRWGAGPDTGAGAGACVCRGGGGSPLCGCLRGGGGGGGSIMWPWSPAFHIV